MVYGVIFRDWESHYPLRAQKNLEWSTKSHKKTVPESHNVFIIVVTDEGSNRTSLLLSSYTSISLLLISLSLLLASCSCTILSKQRVSCTVGNGTVSWLLVQFSWWSWPVFVKMETFFYSQAHYRKNNSLSTSKYCCLVLARNTVVRNGLTSQMGVQTVLLHSDVRMKQIRLDPHPAS